VAVKYSINKDRTSYKKKEKEGLKTPSAKNAENPDAARLFGVFAFVGVCTGLTCFVLIFMG